MDKQITFQIYVNRAPLTQYPVGVYGLFDIEILSASFIMAVAGEDPLEIRSNQLVNHFGSQYLLVCANHVDQKVGRITFKNVQVNNYIDLELRNADTHVALVNADLDFGILDLRLTPVKIN